MDKTEVQIKMKHLLIIFLFFLTTEALQASGDSAYHKISFIPHWLPQTQFAGYLCAFEKGIYKKYKIDLDIKTGGPAAPSSEALKDKKVDFALLWLTNAIQLRDQGVKIVNIAQVVQKSALMLVTKKSSGIFSPKTMENKKVGLWGGDFLIQPMAFFKKYKIKVNPIPQGSSINLFLMDGIDVTSAMWYNEYHTILNAGLDPDELNLFFFSDVGLNFPEDGIYCSEDFFLNNPELCKSFVKASIEGWIYAFNHPEEAIDICINYMKKAKMAANKSHQRWMLSRMKDIMGYNGNTIDIKLKESDYDFVTKNLLEDGLIKKKPDYNSFCKTNNNR